MAGNRGAGPSAGAVSDITAVNKVRAAVGIFAQAGFPLDMGEISSVHKIPLDTVKDIIRKYHLDDDYEKTLKIYRMYYERRSLIANRAERKFDGEGSEFVAALSRKTGLTEEDIIESIRGYPSYLDCMRQYPLYSADMIKKFLKKYSERKKDSASHDPRPSMRTVMDAYRDGNHTIQYLYEMPGMRDVLNGIDSANDVPDIIRRYASANGITFDDVCRTVARRAGISLYDVPKAGMMVEWAQTVMYHKMAGFVGERAAQYGKSVSGANQCDYEDLFQEGMGAVMESMAKYNPEYTTPTTFFNFSLQHALTDAAQTALNNVSSSHYGSRVTAIKRAISAIEGAGMTPTMDAISRVSGKPYAEVARTMQVMERSHNAYLDEQPNIDGFLASQASGAVSGGRNSTNMNPLNSVLLTESNKVLSDAVEKINHDSYIMFCLNEGLEDIERRDADGASRRKKNRTSTPKAASFTMIAQLCKDAYRINERLSNTAADMRKKALRDMAAEMGVRIEYAAQCVRIFEEPQSLGTCTTHSVEVRVTKVRHKLANNPKLIEMYYGGRKSRHSEYVADGNNENVEKRGSGIFFSRRGIGDEAMIDAFDDSFLPEGDIVDMDGNIVERTPESPDVNGTTVVFSIS